MTRTAYLLLFVLACGGGGDGGGNKDATTIDGPPRDAAPDAPPDALSSVVRVDPCPANVAETVTTTNTPNFAFVPSSITINVNDVVKFSPGSIHNVVPHPTKPTDPGLRTGATGEERCLQFTMTGTFNYRCGPHPSMEGVVQVTN